MLGQDRSLYVKINVLSSTIALYVALTMIVANQNASQIKHLTVPIMKVGGLPIAGRSPVQPLDRGSVNSTQALENPVDEKVWQSFQSSQD